MIAKLRPYLTWATFVALVFLVSCVGPAAAECFAKGTITHGAIERMIALATGLRLWFSLIPGTKALPCPSCGTLLATGAKTLTELGESGWRVSSTGESLASANPALEKAMGIGSGAHSLSSLISPAATSISSPPSDKK